jgi:hypothetical protein
LSISKLERDCLAECGERALEVRHRLVNLSASLATLVHLVVQLNVRLAASADNDITQTCLSVEDAVLKSTHWARELEFKPV